MVHYTVGWGPLLAPWLAFPPLLIAWLFLLTALSYVMRAVRVYDWFRPRLAGQFPVVLRLSVLHNTANNLLPMRTGEMVFPWLMRRYFGYGLLDATAVLLWIRILDMHFLGLIGILILDLRDPGWLWWVAGLAWVGGLSLLALIGRRRGRTLAGRGRACPPHRARGRRRGTARPLADRAGLSLDGGDLDAQVHRLRQRPRALRPGRLLARHGRGHGRGAIERPALPRHRRQRQLRARRGRRPGAVGG